MISGVIIGSIDRYSITPLVRVLTRVKPTAPSVPITAAAHEEATPSTMLFHSASKSAASANSSSYHLRENPAHTLEILLSLNE